MTPLARATTKLTVMDYHNVIDSPYNYNATSPQPT